MNLKQLNELLLKYIDQVKHRQNDPEVRLNWMLQVRYLESRQDMQGSFTVNVDR